MIYEALLVALVTALVNGVVVVVTIRVQLSHMRHAINAAHRRLDKIGAPPAGGEMLPG